eukprot:TRINITY_DN644_c0_g1_i1.p1 TRINITY_DN644_c0_g1~~TRINITY_DN644_c0_g1_i1.p1  ORF type:complete len:318 (-),score=62.17 TRINITY_DN644_c0_g1_i1:533-1486(-)
MVGHVHACLDYITLHHPIFCLFRRLRGEFELTRKEKLYLFIHGILLGLSVQFIIQWIFLDCNLANYEAQTCLTGCHDQFGSNNCGNSSGSPVTGYYLYNKTNTDAWETCFGYVTEKEDRHQPELTYQDPCVSACHHTGWDLEIPSGVLTGIDYDTIKSFRDNRQPCSQVPDLDGQILCRWTVLDCGDWRIFLVKVAVAVAVTTPISLIVNVLMRIAHSARRSHRCGNNHSCCVVTVLIFITTILVLFCAAGAYSLATQVLKYNVSLKDVFIQFATSWGIKQALYIPIFGFLYFITCCRHRKDMEEEEELHEKHSSSS